MTLPRFFSSAAVALLLALGAASFLTAENVTGEQKKERVRDRDDLSALWIYDDIPAGFARARAENKPLLIVFR